MRGLLCRLRPKRPLQYGHVYFVSAALPYGRSVHRKVLDWPKVGPGSAQSRPKVSPKSAQSQPKVGSKSAQSWPKVGPSRPKVGPKSAQSRPEVGPKWTQSGPKSAHSRPKVDPKSKPKGQDLDIRPRGKNSGWPGWLRREKLVWTESTRHSTARAKGPK